MTFSEKIRRREQLVAFPFVTLALLLFATPGNAAPAGRAVGNIAIAESIWGGPPPGCASISFGTNPAPRRGGEATIPVPGQPPAPCSLKVHEVEPSAGYTREFVCLLTVHEYGHLHGYQHSSDPKSVMFGASLGPAYLLGVMACDEPGGIVGVSEPPVKRRFKRGATIRQPR